MELFDQDSIKCELLLLNKFFTYEDLEFDLDHSDNMFLGAFHHLPTECSDKLIELPVFERTCIKLTLSDGTIRVRYAFKCKFSKKLLESKINYINDIKFHLDIDKQMVIGFLSGLLLIRFSKTSRLYKVHRLIAKIFGYLCIYIFSASFTLVIALIIIKRVLTKATGYLKNFHNIFHFLFSWL